MRISLRRTAVLAQPSAPGASRALLLIQLTYVLVITVWSLSIGMVPSVEMLAVLAGVLLLWRARDRALLRDLLPFVFLLVCYQGLRGFADNLSTGQIHSEDLISYERALFGGVIPVIWVQEVFVRSIYAPILGPILAGVYMLHFVTPVVFSVALWHVSRTRFQQFVAGLLLVSYAGFVTYLLYPAAPPWWAALHGHLPPGSVVNPEHMFTLTLAGPNRVAAMPSLHAAYSVYVSAFCIRMWGKRALCSVLYPLAIWFSTLYLGHHYVIDLIAGAFYALAGLGIVTLSPRLLALARRKTLMVPKLVSSE